MELSLGSGRPENGRPTESRELGHINQVEPDCGLPETPRSDRHMIVRYSVLTTGTYDSDLFKPRRTLSWNINVLRPSGTTKNCCLQASTSAVSNKTSLSAVVSELHVLHFCVRPPKRRQARSLKPAQTNDYRNAYPGLRYRRVQRPRPCYTERRRPKNDL
jgi:hypothetical protein